MEEEEEGTPSQLQDQSATSIVKHERPTSSGNVEDVLLPSPGASLEVEATNAETECTVKCPIFNAVMRFD